MLMVIVTTVWMGREGYDATSRGYPGMLVSLLSAGLRTLVYVASTVCIGGLFYAAFLRARRGPDRLLIQGLTDLGVVRLSSLVWMLGSAVLVIVDAADASGLPLARLLEPGALRTLVEASYLPRAWLLVLACTSIVFFASTFVRTWQATVGLLGISVVAALAPVLVTQVLVGPNHDFGSDSAIFGTPATAIWFGATAVLLLRYWWGPAPSPVTAGRYFSISVVCWIAVTGTDIILFLFEIAGTPVLSTPTGMLFVGRFMILAALAVVGLFGSHRVPGAGRRVIRPGYLIVLLLFMALYAGVVVSMTRIPPPQYFVPTSIMEVFLGYDVAVRPTLSILLFDWRVNILFLTIAALGTGLYLIGVVKVRRGGGNWPAARATAWILGWFVVVFTTSSGLGQYASASFSLHMIFHMSLNMLAPILLVLGGPVTLALRALTARPGDQVAGCREWVIGILNSRAVRHLYNPLFVLVLFVGSYYALYLTDLFGVMMRYHWSHQLMNLLFLMVGYLYYDLLIGNDSPPRPLPHIGKLGLVLAAMPFHAFFAVIVMTRSSDSLIGKTFYRYLDVPWVEDLSADQYLGGVIAWVAGEIPLLLVVVVLLIQWSRQDARNPSRSQLHLDAGPDDGNGVYSEMLARLDERGQTGTRPDGPTNFEDGKS